MVTNLIIFGTGSVAELAHYYFSHGSEYRVVGFSVDSAFMKEAHFCGLPVVPFETLAASHSAADHALFVALGYSQLNALRREKYLAAKQAGYRLASYISPRASVLNDRQIGEHCFILEDNTIQPFARIGNNVTLWSGNHIGHHSVIHDHCFLASHIVVSGHVTIGESCFIGVNATVRDAVTLGERCVIGAGALILGDTEPEGVYAETATPRAAISSRRLKKI